MKCKLLACLSSTVTEKKRIFSSPVKFMILYVNSKEAPLEILTLLRKITKNKIDYTSALGAKINLKMTWHCIIFDSMLLRPISILSKATANALVYICECICVSLHYACIVATASDNKFQTSTNSKFFFSLHILSHLSLSARRFHLFIVWLLFLKFWNCVCRWGFFRGCCNGWTNNKDSDDGDECCCLR